MDRLPDHRLLQFVRAGQQDAATALYARYARRLTSLARKQMSADLAARVDPDDVVQSVFRTFFRRVDRGEYAIPEGTDLWKLFLVISLNKVRKLGAFHRATKRSISATQLLPGNQQEVVGGESQEDEFQALRLTINELLAELPEPQPEIVALRIEGYDVAQIAERTQRSKRTVERVLQTFRQRLAAIIYEDYPELDAPPADGTS